MAIQIVGDIFRCWNGRFSKVSKSFPLQCYRLILFVQDCTLHGKCRFLVGEFRGVLAGTRVETMPAKVDEFAAVKKNPLSTQEYFVENLCKIIKPFFLFSARGREGRSINQSYEENRLSGHTRASKHGCGQACRYTGRVKERPNCFILIVGGKCVHRKKIFLTFWVPFSVEISVAVLPLPLSFCFPLSARQEFDLFI